MAVIGRIRNMSGLLVIVIGGAMVAFILGDLMNSGGTLFGGNQTEVGEIGGESIDGIQFENEVQRAIENYKRNYNVPSVDENVSQQIREQTWNTLTEDILYGAEYSTIGLRVSSEELFDMVQGDNIHPQVESAFRNPETGQFDRNRVIEFLQSMEEDDQVKARWVSFENDIVRLRKKDKFHNLIKKGINMPQFIGKGDFFGSENKYNISLVVKKYADVADSTIEVSDADVKAYYNDHKNDYEQEASRDVEFVVFRVEPSQEDIDEVLAWFDKTVAEFRTTQNDTIFINRNSDNRFNSTWKTAGTTGFTADIDSILFNEEPGYIHGPFNEGFTYGAVKILDEKVSPDSVKARHIFLDPSQDPEKTEALADSLFEVIKNGGDFDVLAFQFSNDPGTKEKGGDLGWFKEDAMVPALSNACFDGKVGEPQLIKSRIGWHIVEPTEQADKVTKRRFATLSRMVLAGKKTRQELYAKADEFARSVSDQESFDAKVSELNLNKRYASNLKQNDRNIAGLTSPREMIRWAYESEKGSVSKVFEFTDDFVVGIVSEVREDGFTDIEMIRDELEAKVRTEKLAEQFIEEFQNAGGSTIQEVAANMGLTVDSRTGITFNSGVIQGYGRELEVVGTLGAMQAGSLSKPIKGTQGVYVVSVDSKVDAAELANYLSQSNSLSTSVANRVDFDVLNAIKEKGDIVDNRGKFY